MGGFPNGLDNSGKGTAGIEKGAPAWFCGKGEMGGWLGIPGSVIVAGIPGAGPPAACAI